MSSTSPSPVVAATIVHLDPKQILTNAACQALEAGLSDTTSSNSRNLVIEAGWLHDEERRQLPWLLTYLAFRDGRATLELPATRFDEWPMALFEAFGGAVLERDASEPIGATREVANAFLSGGNSFLVLENFVPAAGNTIKKPFSIDSDSGITITVLITEPTGRVIVRGPSGQVRETRRTAKAYQWDIIAPEKGRWTVEVENTLRTRIFVQTQESDFASAPPFMPCHPTGAVGVSIPLKATWQLERLTLDGLKPFERGAGPVETIRIDSEGVYSLTWRESLGGNERIHRAGIHIGSLRPLLFREFPRGLAADTEGECGIHCAFLSPGINPEGLSASVSGRPARIELGPCGRTEPIRTDDVHIIPSSELDEGNHVVEVRTSSNAGSFTDSWLFTLDRPYSEDIQISEIHPDEGWFEVHALTNIADLSEYAVSDLDSSFVSLPARPVNAGDRVAIQVGAGGSEARVNASHPLRLSGRDQIVLVKGTAKDFAVIDAVVFDDGETSWTQVEKEDNDFLAARGEWSGPPVMLPGLHASLVRTGGDANSAADWHASYYPATSASGRVDLSLENVKAGDVTINEVGLWGKEKPWIEIQVNRGPIDIAAFSITDFDGPKVRVGDVPRMIQNGERLVLQWGSSNQNSDTTIYLAGSPPNKTTDQAAILLGSRIIDVIAWRQENEPIPVDELADLAFAKIAPIVRPQFLPSTEFIASLAKRPEGNGWDWSVVPTPGAANRIPKAPELGVIKIAALSPSEFQSDWAELVCLSGPLDISNFVLSDLDGHDDRLCRKPVTLLTGEKVIVHWSDGTNEDDDVGDLNKNGVRDLFLPHQSNLSTTDDQLVLIWGTKIYDAVVFTNGDGAMSKDEQKDLKYLIDHGAWTGSVSQSSAVNIGTYRLPIERRPGSSDSNSKDEWTSRSPASK